MAFSSTKVLVCCGLGGAIYSASIICYRLFFHPLRNIPGPRLAASSMLYEFYWDIVKPGKLVFRLQELHAQYGPIIRITPREVHIRDSDFYEELYATRNRRQDKDAEWVKFSMPGSIFSTAPHELHRIRRAPLNSFFSSLSVLQLGPLIWQKVEKFCKRLESARLTEEVLYLDAAFMALTSDVISDFAFGREWNYLDDPQFGLEWLETIRGGSQSAQVRRMFPWMQDLMAQLPRSRVKVMVPPLYHILEWRQRVMQDIVSVFEREAESQGGATSHRMIFHELKSSNLPESELKIQRVADEACIIVSAGAETTARTLKLIIYYLLVTQDALNQLETEPREERHDRSSESLLTALKQLPYLVSIMHEQ